MPTRRLRLTKTEDQEYRACLLRLEQRGIPIGCVGDPPRAPEQLTLEQIDHPLATVYDLPSGVAVVVPAKLAVLKSGMLIMDLEMTTPWNDCQLDLSPPEKGPYYQDLIRGLPSCPPRVLNHLLKSEFPLRRCHTEGVIIAYGWGSVPPTCHDETLVTVKLSLTDERRNELCFEFEARVDRSVRRKYEPRLKGRLKAARMGLREALRRKKPSSAPTPAMTITHAALQRLQNLKLEEARDERKQQARVKARTKRKKGNRNQGPSSYAQELAEARSRFLQALSR